MRLVVRGLFVAVAASLVLASACAAPRTAEVRLDGDAEYVFTEVDTDLRIDVAGEAECRIDRAPSHGSLEGNGGELLYSPEPSYAGADSFSCRTTQGGQEREVVFGITVGRFTVEAVTETDPIEVEGDAADDMAIWLHSFDPPSSLIVGTDDSHGGSGGLYFYDLAGGEIRSGTGNRINHVDVRYGFRLGGQEIDLIAVTNRSEDAVNLFSLTDRDGLRRVGETGRGVTVDFHDARSNRVGVYGLCLYRSAASGRYYAFVTSKTGFVAQVELEPSDRVEGTVKGTVVRSFDVNPGKGLGRDGEYYVESCVADDFQQALYVAERDVGIWRYGAEPDDGDERSLVAKLGPEGNLPSAGGVRGLAIYMASESAGYLIAATTGDDAFTIYDREQGNGFITKFRVVEGQATDGVASVEGIDVTGFSLGGDFESGLFVARDADNIRPGSTGYANYKLVRWADIAKGIEPNLIGRTEFDPR